MSTPTKGDTALVGVDTYQSNAYFKISFEAVSRVGGREDILKACFMMKLNINLHKKEQAGKLHRLDIKACSESWPR